jgi:dethiobiotin synthetase
MPKNKDCMSFPRKRESRTIFITATDTGVGKTVTTYALSVLLKAKGHTVGLMKPVQCAGDDARFLKAVNPFYAPEPLSPHLALRRAKIKFDKRKVKAGLKELRSQYEIVLVEGAGGLMVPIMDNYYNADMIADLKAEVVIVSRLGLGTINHTLLTINELKKRKLKIAGIIFSQSQKSQTGLPEQTNPQEIEKLSGVKVLGIIPYIKPLNPKNVLKQCQNVTLPV